MNRPQAWAHLDRMQIAANRDGFLALRITEKKFLSMPDIEQRRYYDFMRTQVHPTDAAPKWVK